MQAHVITKKKQYSIDGADRLAVSGSLVLIQRRRQSRAGDFPDGYETIAVVGGPKLDLVTLGDQPPAVTRASGKRALGPAVAEEENDDEEGNGDEAGDPRGHGMRMDGPIWNVAAP